MENDRLNEIRELNPDYDISMHELENPASFQVLCEDLLPVSKYELLSDFVNLSVEEL